jgi:hypothetical protein
MGKISKLFLVGMILIAFPVFGRTEEGMTQKMEVQSSAFNEGDRIPSDFTCDGADMSPPIEWAVPSIHVGSIAIIVDDPDAPAGNWTHWLVYDLPSHLTQLPAGIPSGVCKAVQILDRLAMEGLARPEGNTAIFLKFMRSMRCFI